ncbi:hypothetical protein XH92_15945 [Bradyrhizobium sp. CCBAU 53421]|nr:hypothetical protein XH92_15945 [Bradyrhizobium sp. CCBAU 53421]
MAQLSMPDWTTGEREAPCVDAMAGRRGITRENVDVLLLLEAVAVAIKGRHFDKSLVPVCPPRGKFLQRGRWPGSAGGGMVPAIIMERV